MATTAVTTAHSCIYDRAPFVQDQPSFDTCKFMVIYLSCQQPNEMRICQAPSILRFVAQQMGTMHTNKTKKRNRKLSTTAPNLLCPTCV